MFRAPPPPRPPWSDHNWFPRFKSRTTLVRILRVSDGCSSNHWPSFNSDTDSTTGRTSEETSLSLVCDENLGSGTLTDSTQVRPPRMPSPRGLTFSFLEMPDSSAYLLSVRVSAPRKPARWVPPSRCGMLLVKHSIVS